MKNVSQRLFEYPPSKRGNVVETLHDTAVPDPFRWLEDPHADETKAWIAAQNEFTQAYLAELPARESFRRRLAELWDYPKWTPPQQKNGRLLYTYNDGLQNQPVLYQQRTADAKPEVVLDPNTLSDDGTIALMQTTMNDNGRLLAYTLSQSGSDWQEIHLRNLDTGDKLDDVLRWCKFTSIAWTPDHAGFYYARYPSPEEMPDAPPSTHQRVYYHRLGTPQSEDALIYARPDAPELGFQPEVTHDGRYLLLHVWEGTDRRNRIYYRDLHGSSDVVRLLDEMDAKYIFVGNDGPVFYFETDLDAPNGRVIAIDVTQPQRGHWRELIPEQEDAIAFTTLVHDQFIIARLHHAHHRLFVHHLDGAPAQEIHLPTIGSIFALSGERKDTEMYIQFLSFLYPPTILKYDFTESRLTLHNQPQLDFDPDQYETTQVFYESKDGTRVPMFLTHKKGLERDGTNPTLLYGYGGFNVSLTPLFSPTRLAWIERGGIYAQACLRGGNEYGEAWHEAGMLANKQNVFDDFIAAAEWLVANDYTRPAHLAIEGRSNGGLLVAACLTQRPDLFGAVHCGVPVIDMLRYHMFTAGRYWTSEYGNAEADPEHFRFMMAYSPLHNVKTAVHYPPTLITTADTDDRVVPMHAMKFAATLQTAAPGTNPHLIRIETRAGHGMGKPTSKLIEEATDVYSFLWAHLTSHRRSK